MPAGPPICALRVSGRRTSGNGFSGWRSPAAQEAGIILDRLVTKEGQPWTPGQRAYDRETGRLCETGLVQQAAIAGWPTPNTPSGGRSVDISQMSSTGMTQDGRKHTVSLEHVAKFAANSTSLSGWPSPQAHDVTTRGNTMADHHHYPHDLSNAAELTAWSTPQAGDYKGSSGAGARKRGEFQRRLGNDVQTLAGWATPKERDYKSAVWSPEKMAEHASRHTPSLEIQTSGLVPSGSPASTAKRGALNPRFSLWLMGYPTAWASCGERVILSSRKSPLSSSEP